MCLTVPAGSRRGATQTTHETEPQEGVGDARADDGWRATAAVRRGVRRTRAQPAQAVPNPPNRVRLQANAEGGLSERAQRRAEEPANVADVRVTPPRDGWDGPKRARRGPSAAAHPADRRLPPVGSAITRKYKGRSLTVTVLADGFEWEGERYGSLTAVAKAITGSHINGFRFFNRAALQHDQFDGPSDPEHPALVRRSSRSCRSHSVTAQAFLAVTDTASAAERRRREGGPANDADARPPRKPVGTGLSSRRSVRPMHGLVGSRSIRR